MEKQASAKPHNTDFIKISLAVSATHIKNNNILESLTDRGVGRDSSVGIAIRYGLDGSGIESWWRDFLTRPDPPSLLQNRYWVSFLGIKRPGRDAGHPSPSNAMVKERVELYLYPILGFHGLLQGGLYLFNRPWHVSDG